VDKANEDCLGTLLPSLVHIKADDESLNRVHSLLAMSEKEARQPGPASEFGITRLIELILVQILRTGRSENEETSRGLVAGLANPMIAPALAAMHRDVARSWTVGELAKICAMFRSTFALKFRSIVGTAPIDYLLNWRMILAKDALSRGTKSVSGTAFSIGFQSSSAFTTAFTRAAGCSPTRFAERISSAAGLKVYDYSWSAAQDIAMR